MAMKTKTWGEMVDWIKERDKNFKGKMEKTDHDLIAYGVNRQRDVLLPSGKIIRKRKK
jgi:hypothetical protein